MSATPRLPLLGFWLIYPGFFIYHALVAQGLPAVLRGYSVLAAALTLPLVAAAWWRSAPALRRVHDIDLLVGGFLTALLMTAIWHATQGAAPEIVGAHLGVVPQWLVLYTLARLYPWGTAAGRQSMLGAWLLMSALMLFQAGEAAFVAATLDVVGKATDELATYQDFGLLYLIVTISTMVQTAGAAGRALVLAPALLALFLNGARSEFLALLFAAVLIGWALSRWRLAFALLALAVMVAAPLSFEPLANWLPDNRIVDLLENQAEGSLGERHELLLKAWETLARHPMGGDYASYAPGEYAHNVMSAWVDLGAAGFAWTLLMLLLPALHLALDFPRFGRERLFLLAATGVLLSLLLLAGAKSFTYNLAPFALGAYAAFRVRLSQT